MNLDFRSKTRRPRCSTRDFRNRIGKGRNNQLLVRKANLLGKIIATPDIFKLHGGFDHVGDRSHELFAPAEVEMEGDGIGVSCVQLGGHLLRGVPLADCAGIHFGEEFLVVVELDKNVAANAQTSALARLAHAHKTGKKQQTQMERIEGHSGKNQGGFHALETLPKETEMRGRSEK